MYASHTNDGLVYTCSSLRICTQDPSKVQFLKELLLEGYSDPFGPVLARVLDQSMPKQGQYWPELVSEGPKRVQIVDISPPTCISLRKCTLEGHWGPSEDQTSMCPLGTSPMPVPPGTPWPLSC